MSLSAESLLRAWDRAAAEPPFERALTLLGAAGAREDALASLSIGERDAALLRLRMRLFGDEATAVADCPGCGARLELAFRVSTLLAPTPDDAALRFTHDGCEIELRRVTTADLRAIAPHPTAEALLERVLVRAEGERPEATPEWLAEIGDRLERADPQAHVEIALSCPECGQTWTGAYDVVTFLWQEIEEWAGRMLRDVHLLASAYGWSERDILDLPASRRRRYLALVLE